MVFNSLISLDKTDYIPFFDLFFAPPNSFSLKSYINHFNSVTENNPTTQDNNETLTC